MPNWCFNTATFEHADRSMLDKLIGAANEGKLFDTFVPMPEELRNTQSPSEPDEVLIEKYGYSDWYSWSINNWGTKWEAREVSVDDGDSYVQLTFDTAWAPPIEFYDEMKALGFRIDATYTEEGMGFAGVYVNGEDKCVDLGDLYESATPEEDIGSIEDEDLRYLVREEYERYVEMQEESGE